MAYRNSIKFDLSLCNDCSNKSLAYHLGMLCECTGRYVYICICVFVLYIHVYVDICKVFTRTDVLCAYVLLAVLCRVFKLLHFPSL